MEIYKNLDINDLENEVWKVITDFPDYQISNFGRVKSLKFKKERLLKQQKDSHDYFIIGLSKNGKVKIKYVHRLVFETFVEKLKEGYDAHHINEDKENNIPENLESKQHGKHIENHRKGKKHSEKTKNKMSENHADFKGQNAPMFGKHHSNESKNKMSRHNLHKLPYQKHIDICIDIEKGIYTQVEMAKKHGVDQTTISKIKTNLIKNENK